MYLQYSQESCSALLTRMAKVVQVLTQPWPTRCLHRCHLWAMFKFSWKSSWKEKLNKSCTNWWILAMFKLIFDQPSDLIYSKVLYAIMICHILMAVADWRLTIDDCRSEFSHSEWWWSFRLSVSFMRLSPLPSHPHSNSTNVTVFRLKAISFGSLWRELSRALKWTNQQPTSNKPPDGQDNAGDLFIRYAQLSFFAALPFIEDNSICRRTGVNGVKSNAPDKLHRWQWSQSISISAITNLLDNNQSIKIDAKQTKETNEKNWRLKYWRWMDMVERTGSMHSLTLMWRSHFNCNRLLAIGQM